LSVVSETHILSSNLQAKVLQALENAGVFTSGGLVKDKVFKSSFLRQNLVLVSGLKKPSNNHIKA